MYRTKAPRSVAGAAAEAASVGDERVQVEARESLAAAEECQLDDEAGPDDDASDLLYEAPDRLDGAAGRQHVVVDHDPRAVGDQLGMKLERVRAVLERVARADRLRRQLAGPARGHEPDA